MALTLCRKSIEDTFWTAVTTDKSEYRADEKNYHVLASNGLLRNQRDQRALQESELRDLRQDLATANATLTQARKESQQLMLQVCAVVIIARRDGVAFGSCSLSALIAQSGERTTEDREVAGAKPARGIIILRPSFQVHALQCQLHSKTAPHESDMIRKKLDGDIAAFRAQILPPARMAAELDLMK